MRVVFAGSGEFSLPSLRALAASGHPVTLVITAPDRGGSRGRPAPRPVLDLARELGLPVEQPDRLSATWAAATSLVSADLLVVCAYGQLVPASVLQLVPQAALGVHPSLLPRHRGASPIAAAILAGDSETGVSIYRMDERLDAGPLLAQERVPILGDATKVELELALAEVGARLLVTALAGIDRGEAVLSTQDEGLATYSHKVTRRDGELDWDLPALEIDRKLRALSPWPGVSVLLAGIRVKLLAGTAQPLPEAVAAAPGTVIGSDAGSVLVGTGQGAYRASLVQPPGGRPMPAPAFLRGRRSPVGGEVR
ncbi:MAG: methionyl-tRNA formyltransferase [Candidatus Dormibacteria bacterium]